MVAKSNIGLLALVSVLFIVGCQSMRPTQPSKPFTPQVVTSGTPTVTPTPTQQTTTVTPPVSTPTVVTPQIITPQFATGAVKGLPKFGIIFSAGGAKAWAHVGVLKEMQKFKFPVISVAGIEWGSVVAASFAQNASVNEVEWELAKFKNIDDWQEFVQAAFARKNTQDFKMPFVCPSVNLKTKTSYMLNRGQVDQFIPYCIPSAGLTKPFGNSVANLTDLNLTIQHLKATGVNKIILINVIAGKRESAIIKSVDSPENQIWAQFAASMAKKSPGIDEVIEIDLGDYDIDDFDKRRDIMVKGSELGYSQVKRIADKYRL
ncbi:hypothetical protein CIK05_14910 [Bdellovibrio sp. qaytius]|nr:hypothetical protein CIK05_14910 [Bdellovibrio sp. qaytius]